MSLGSTKDPFAMCIGLSPSILCWNTVTGTNKPPTSGVDLGSSISGHLQCTVAFLHLSYVPIQSLELINRQQVELMWDLGYQDIEDN